ncbi:MAG: hypothetical protein ACK52I_12705 [Pseudomonadota bacterium]|jgi:hypothetical protein
MSNYPPGGVLFHQDKKTNPKAPDYTGNLEISRDTLNHLVAMAKKEQPLKMQLSGWKKPTKNGGTFLSLVAAKPYEKNSGGSSSRDDDDSVPF